MMILINDFERLVMDKQVLEAEGKPIGVKEIKFQIKQQIMMDATLSTIGVLEEKLNYELYRELKKISKHAFFVNVSLIIVLSALTVLLWKLFVQGFENRVAKAKLVLMLFPVNFLNTNSKIKRFLNDTCTSVVIN